MSKHRAVFIGQQGPTRLLGIISGNLIARQTGMIVGKPFYYTNKDGMIRTAIDFEFPDRVVKGERFAEWVAEGMSEDREGRYVVFVHNLPDDHPMIPSTGKDVAIEILAPHLEAILPDDILIADDFKGLPVEEP
jgi:hypothetical protein